MGFPYSDVTVKDRNVAGDNFRECFRSFKEMIILASIVPNQERRVILFEGLCKREVLHTIPSPGLPCDLLEKESLLQDNRERKMSVVMVTAGKYSCLCIKGGERGEGNGRRVEWVLQADTPSPGTLGSGSSR